ncbi:MAG: prephenate dehydratase domain-containing protein [Planctomycetota bacterium]
MTAPTTIAYLGPAGTFSEQAALAVRNGLGLADAALATEASIRRVASRVEPGTLGVLPAYNLLEGAVQETLDALFYDRLHAIAMVRAPIIFVAATKEPADRYHTVCSHPKALGQCDGSIRREHPDANVVPTASTAAAAERAAAEPGVVALCSASAAASRRLHVLNDDAGDRRYGRANTTEFLVLADRDVSVIDGADRTILLAAPEVDRPGVLRDILDECAGRGLNVAKLHVRPSPIGVGHDADAPQAFLLELVAAPDDPAVADAASAIVARFSGVATSLVRVVGGYPSIGLGSEHPG